MLKLAIFDVDDAEHGAAPHFARFRDTQQVVVSGPHWIDVMNLGVHKGSALVRLREVLGIDGDQCLAFGDYLNDLELLKAAGHSFAMANGHPDVVAAARYVAPRNTENGVVRVLEQLLG